MHLRQLWLTDFRSYREATLELAPGLTALVGANGAGKSNVVEAIAYLATLASFRGAPTEALVRSGAERGVVRGEAVREGRTVLIEAEIAPWGRSRVQVNRQRLARARDLLGALRVTVFAPDDLVLVKGGPAERRRYLDDALVAARPRHDDTRTEVDRVLRQRNALLKQAGNRPDDAALTTLDVWDERLTTAGTALGDARDALLVALAPRLTAAYRQVASQPAEIGCRYVAGWRNEGLAAALAASRRDDLRRGVSLVGPHRDDVELTIDGMPARTHASQGEQRSLALALRLASHAVVAEAAGSDPVLLLDDVFSELDPERSASLLAHLPPGQTVLTTAAHLPPGAVPESVVEVRDGALVGG